MNFNAVIFNESGRVRSGLRFLIYTIFFMIVSAVLLGAGVAILSALPVGFTPYSLESFVLQFGVSFAVAVFFAWLCGRLFEDLPFRALGFWWTKNWFVNLVYGCAFGAASFALAAVIPMISGAMSFRYNDAAGTTALALTLASTLLIFTFGAAFEEAFFRGYPLQTFSRSGLAIFATILTSIMFATVHNANPGANPFSWFNTFLAGIWLAVAYFKTRDLWFPFGVHLMWNWFQGAVFGVNVSGLDKLAPAPLMRAVDNGPVWLTGGSYGIEGGVACTVALLISTAAIYFLPLPKPSEEMLAFSSEEKPVNDERGAAIS